MFVLCIVLLPALPIINVSVKGSGRLVSGWGERPGWATGVSVPSGRKGVGSQRADVIPAAEMFL